ncbi:MAG: glutamyl-tRNA reductase [bacterium]|nr:glutamyl-tRNA reductase [bacterium]
MATKQIVCLGLNHRSAPVDLRERVDCSLAELDAYVRLTEGDTNAGAVSEFCLLKTCNRVELYAVRGGANDNSRDAFLDVLTRGNQIVRRSIRDHTYWFEGDEALEHLCRVATSLDSLVLGEAQILGQVTRSHQAAVQLGTCGPTLRRAFQTAVRAGKRSRTETAIGAKSVSVSSVAIALSQKVVGDLRERRIAVVGLGEMGMMTLKVLRARGLKHVSIANRTIERAREVGAEWNYPAHSLDELPAILREADVVFTATGSSEPIIRPDLVRPVVADRKRPLVLIDISVPRSIEVSVKEISGVRLFDTEDLSANLDEGLSARKREVPQVETIIKEEIDAHLSGVKDPAIGPVITDLRQKAEDIRRREIERTLKQIGKADPETKRHIQNLSHSLVNKLLHEPTTRLKECDGNEHESYAHTVRELFGLGRPRNREP